MRYLSLLPIILLLILDFAGYGQTNGTNKPFKTPRVIITQTVSKWRAQVQEDFAKRTKWMLR